MKLGSLINDALYSSKSTKNLLSFKDIRRNGYHIETMNEGITECVYITSIVFGKKLIVEKLSAFSYELYPTNIKSIESYFVVNQKFNNPKTFVLWHEKLGHSRSLMIWRIIKHSHGHPLTNQKILLPNECLCVVCLQGKLIVIPSFNKVTFESPIFLERIHEDIFGPIHPPSGHFRYFMVLIDVFTRWSHVCLLSTRNVAFVRLLVQMIKLRVQFPDFPMKTVKLDNAIEFTSQTFTDYCMSVRINIEHHVTHAHTQNGLVKSLIKRLQLIARPMLMKTKLQTSA